MKWYIYFSSCDYVCITLVSSIKFLCIKSIHPFILSFKNILLGMILLWLVFMLKCALRTLKKLLGVSWAGWAAPWKPTAGFSAGVLTSAWLCQLVENLENFCCKELKHWSILPFQILEIGIGDKLDFF